MAFPLMFVDEHGVLRRYRWPEYPVMVIRPLPTKVWSDNSGPPGMSMDVRTVIYCGPPAPNPKPPTADEFRDGLARWMADTEWSWLYR